MQWKNDKTLRDFLYMCKEIKIQNITNFRELSSSFVWAQGNWIISLGHAEDDWALPLPPRKPEIVGVLVFF
jgi:hypothetical protein